MYLNSVTSAQVTDSATQERCNELLRIVSAQNWDIEQALSIHNQLDTYIGKALKHNPSFYSESELKFLIAFIAQLAKLLDSEKQKLSVEIIKKQRNKNAVNKYKSNS